MGGVSKDDDSRDGTVVPSKILRRRRNFLGSHRDARKPLLIALHIPRPQGVIITRNKASQWNRD